MHTLMKTKYLQKCPGTITQWTTWWTINKQVTSDLYAHNFTLQQCLEFYISLYKTEIHRQVQTTTKQILIFTVCHTLLSLEILNIEYTFVNCKNVAQPSLYDTNL